jgi:hypothetical protein
MRLRPKVFRLTFHVVLLGIAALLFGASPAQAGPLVDQAVSCDSYVFEQPFAQWEAVPFDYVLAPDGGFERRALGWQLTGGARVVRGNEKYYVHRRADAHSLYLPAGATATSPAMCAGVEYPTLRLFARNRGSNVSILNVEMLYEDLLGKVQSVPLLPLLESGGLGSTLTASSRWEPTLPMVLPSAFLLPATLSSNTAAIAFRFSPQGNADWSIDDAYVDPYRRY